MNLWPFRWNPFAKIKRKNDVLPCVSDEPVDLNDAVSQILFSVLEKYKNGKCHINLGFDIRYRAEQLTDAERTSINAFDLALEREMKYDTLKKQDDIVQCEYFDLSYWLHKSTSKVVPGKTTIEIQDVKLRLKKISPLSTEFRKSYNVVSTLHVDTTTIQKFMRQLVKEYYTQESKNKEKHALDVLAELKKQ